MSNAYFAVVTDSQFDPVFKACDEATSGDSASGRPQHLGAIVFIVAQKCNSCILTYLPILKLMGI